MNKKILNASEMGKLGGVRTKTLYGLDHYKKIGKLGGRPKKVKDEKQKTV